MKTKLFLIGALCAIVLVACAAPTPVPPTPTAIPPTLTPVPPTSVPLLPTPTAVPIVTTGEPLEFVWRITGDPNPFSAPVGIAAEADGTFYVIDAGNSRVQKFDRNGKFLTMWGTQGEGDGQFGFRFMDSGCVTVDAEGNLYVGDWDNYRVQKFDRNGKFLTKWGNDSGEETRFSGISDIAIDKQGNVYVTDYMRNVVQKFDRNGKFLLRWGSAGGKDGQFLGLMSVALDPDGNVLLGDETGRIQKFDSSGKFLSRIFLATLHDRGVTFWHIEVDSHRNIYTADHRSYRILKLNSIGNPLAVWGSQGAGAGQFSAINHIALDQAGNLYATDRDNNTVQKFRQPLFRP